MLMWFKNLIIYRLNKSFSITSAELEEKLSQQPFRHCGKTECTTLGWTCPLPEGNVLVHESNRCLLFAACQEERILPASVIRDAVEEKIIDIQAGQDRKVFRKEKEQIKEEVTLNLLPKAFTRRKLIHGYIDLENNQVVLNVSAVGQAEKVTSLLRKCIGSLPLGFMETNDAPNTIMTHWIKQPETLPDTIVLGDECELVEPGEGGGIVRCKYQELSSSEVLEHIASSKLVNKLGIQWKDVLSASIQHDLSVKRLKFFDALTEQSESRDNDDILAKVDADFTLMVLTLRQFLSDIFQAFGGESNVSLESHQKIKQVNVLPTPEPVTQ